jgi:hypothetical protein
MSARPVGHGDLDRFPGAGAAHGAVLGADLHVGVTGGSCGLPLLTLANGTQIRLTADHNSQLHYSDGSAR